MDHFSHPLLFARCGVKWTAKGALEEAHHGGSEFGLGNGALEDVADVFSLSSTFKRLHHSDGPTDLCDDLYLPIPSTASIGGNLATMRSVLSYTPLLKSLSLTGILERALCGTRSPPALNALRSLTLGPPPARWKEPLRLDHPALANVERLRICGCMLRESEIECIAGRKGALPKLREVQWSLPSKFDNDEGLR